MPGVSDSSKYMKRLKGSTRFGIDDFCLFIMPSISIDRGSAQAPNIRSELSASGDMPASDEDGHVSHSPMSLGDGVSFDSGSTHGKKMRTISNWSSPCGRTGRRK